jgi:hypothetical protein
VERRCGSKPTSNIIAMIEDRIVNTANCETDLNSDIKRGSRQHKTMSVVFITVLPVLF